MTLVWHFLETNDLPLGRVDGFGGGDKVFLMEFSMPLDEKARGFNADMPSIVSVFILPPCFSVASFVVATPLVFPSCLSSLAFHLDTLYCRRIAGTFLSLSRTYTMPATISPSAPSYHLEHQPCLQLSIILSPFSTASLRLFIEPPHLPLALQD